MGHWACTLFLIVFVNLLPSFALGQPIAQRPADPPAAAGAPLPAGVQADWWSQVQADIQKEEYEITWQDSIDLPDQRGAYQAPNRAQGFRTYFTDDGVRLVPQSPEKAQWEWGLALAEEEAGSWKPEAGEKQKPGIHVSDNRIEFDRGWITEWYVNSPEGLEQGFTIPAPLPAAGSWQMADGEGAVGAVREPPRAHRDAPLQIDLILSGNLHPKFADDGQAVDFYDGGDFNVIHYAKLIVTDATGRVLPSHFEGFAFASNAERGTLSGSSGGIRIAIDAEGAAYPITIDPLATAPAWTVESDNAYAELGYAVATAGDVNGDGYSDVVVGAYNFGSTTWMYPEGYGKCYLYLGGPSGLSSAATWTASGGDAYDNFGWSVGTAGDVNGDGYADVIVGAPGDSNGESNEGRAFVYLGTSSGLSSAPAWTAESNQAGARLGDSVATAGDVNGDGYSDVIAGASSYGNGQSWEGKAFAWLGTAAGLGPNGTPDNADWAAESDQYQAYFGCAVGTAGDVNGDGYSDVIVGSDYYDNGQNSEGRAWVYFGSAAGLSPAAAWTAEGEQADAWFGSVVGTAGDVNGDGYSDVIVGSRTYDNGSSNEGAAFVWFGSATGLGANGTPANADWTAEGNINNALFGASVGMAGDVNGDGYADVIVGAPDFHDGVAYVGRTYVFLGGPAGPSTSVDWAVNGGPSSGFFGVSVATAGDVNGDGYSDVIVGQNKYDNGQQDEGRAYVYLGSASGLASTASQMLEADQAYASFGYSVATAGDVNGDGYSDVIVGAHTNDSFKGKAYLFLGGPSGLSGTAAWTATGEGPGNYFGVSVATAGDVNGDGYSDVVVGAEGYNNNWTGKSYLYLGGAAGLSGTAAWTVVGEHTGDRFGVRVATAGDVNGDGYSDVAVGAACYSSLYGEGGKAYLYQGGPSGLSATPSWTALGEGAVNRFGHSIGTAGDVNGDGYSDVVVGAFSYNYSLYRGKAYLYLGGPSGLAAAPSWTATGEADYDYYGVCVATAGDVNGDGYADVVVGARNFNGAMGKVYLYPGGPSGLSATAAWTATGEAASNYFGYSVATAGDVNGDGYSDVVVGALLYGANAGKAYAYLGEPSGLSAMAAWTATGEAANNYFSTVATAGDVNGDGYSDVIVGAYHHDNGQAEEGAAFIYYGGGGKGVPYRSQQWRADLTAPIAPLGLALGEQFKIGLRLRTPYGRANVKTQWQAVPLGASFAPGINPVQSETLWVNSGVSGTTRQTLVDLPGQSGPFKWRTRIKYHTATSPFQQHSRWFTPAANGLQETDLRVMADVACVLPDEAVWLYSVIKSVPDNYPILNFQDPNQANQRTGWNIRRSSNPTLPKSSWPLLGSNVVDMDAGAVNYQYTDFTGATGTWYYQVSAYNSYCPAEGPF